MNAITSRLDVLRARKKEIEESRKQNRVSSGGSSESLNSNHSNTDKDKDSKPLSPSLVEQHQEPGSQNLPFKAKATAPVGSNNNKPDTDELPPPISPDELANAKRRIAELERILNGLDAQLERTQEELEDAREAADNYNSKEAVQVDDSKDESKSDHADAGADATDQLATIQFFGDQIKDLKEENVCLLTEMQMAVDNAGSARRQLDKIQQENLEFEQMIGTEVVHEFRDLHKQIGLLQKLNKNLVETQKEAMGEETEELTEQIQYLQEKGMQLRTRLDDKEDDLQRADDRIAALDKEKAHSQLTDDDTILTLENEAGQYKHHLQDAKTRIESLEEELEITNTARSAQIVSEMDQALRTVPTANTYKVSTLELQLKAATSRIAELEEKLQVGNVVIQPQIETETEIVQQPTEPGDNENDNGADLDEKVVVASLRQQLLSSQRQTKQVESELKNAQKQLEKSKNDLEESQKKGHQARTEQAAAEDVVKILHGGGLAEKAADSESLQLPKYLEQEGVRLRQEVDNIQAKFDTTQKECDAAQVIIPETEEKAAAIKETSSDQVKYLQELVASLGKKLDETQQELRRTKSKLEEMQLGLERVGNEMQETENETEAAMQEAEKASSNLYEARAKIKLLESQQQSPPKVPSSLQSQPSQASETIESLRKELQDTKEYLANNKAELEHAMLQSQPHGEGETIRSLRQQLEETQEHLANAKSEFEQALEPTNGDSASSSAPPPEVQQQLLSEKLAGLQKQVAELRKELEEREGDVFLAQRQLLEAKQDLEKIPALETKLAELEQEKDWVQQKLRNELIERLHDVEEAREEMEKAKLYLEDARERIQMLQAGPEPSSVDMQNMCSQIASTDEGDETNQSRVKSVPLSPQISEPADNDRMNATRKELEETQDDLSLARRQLREAQEEIRQLKTLETKIVDLQKESDWTEQKLRNELIEREHEAEEAKQRLKPFESQLAGTESSGQSQQGKSFDAMEQLRGKSAKDKVVALRNELDELRNELEEAQDDAQDAQKRLEDVNAEVEQLKQELEQRCPMDHKNNVTERIFRTDQFQTERDLSEAPDELREALAKINMLELQSEEAQSEAFEAQQKLNAATSELENFKLSASQDQGPNMTEQILRNELVETRYEIEEILERLNEATGKLQQLEQQSSSTRLAIEENLKAAVCAPKSDQLPERAKQKAMIQEELCRIIKETEENELDEQTEHEAIGALKIAAMKVAHLKKHHDVINDEFIDFPTVGAALMNYALLEGAEKHYGGEEDEFLMDCSAARRADALSAASANGNGNDNDEDYMSMLAVDVDIRHNSEDFDADGKTTEREGASTTTAKETGAVQQTRKIAAPAAGQSEKHKRAAMIDAELTMVIEEAIESELEEKFEPEALEALKKAAFKIYYLNKYYDGINDKLSDNEARQSELIEQLKLLRLEEEAVMSGAEDEVEENEFQQELMGESQREAMHDSFVESYERRSPKASNLSHTMEYTQERFHALKEVIKDLRHTVQKFQQEKMSISEELDLIQCDRDEAVAASRHVLEGRDSGPNFEATRVPFAQFKEGRKELRLTIQGLEAGKGTINQDVEDERTARKLAEKETAEVKASLVICQRNLKEAHEYFAVLLDTNKQLKADKRRFICELESAEGTGAVRSVPKKENRLDSQDRGLAMEYAALESTSPHVSGNDSGGDLEYPVKLEEETDFKEARQGIRNELDGLRDKIQTLAAEKYQINQERDADNQACQDTKKRVEELEAAIFTFKKNLDEAHSYFQELKKKNSGLRIEIQRVEAEKIELSEETTAAKKRCAEDEARRDQMDESLRDIQRNQEGALHSFGLLRQQNENLEEENDCLVQERDDAKQALEAVDQRTQEMTKALTFYLQNLEEAHSCFESLRGANEELKDERDAASTARDEAETRADLLAQTLSTVRKNLDEAHGAFGDIQHQNEDLRFKIHIFHEERQLIEDAGDGKFPLLQLIATLKEEINSLKTDIAKGELRERELQDAMTSQQTNLEEDRARFGTLRSEIDDLRTKNAALKELDMENLQKEVEELRVQNQECAEAQHELKTKLTSMETTNAWKLHTNEVQLSQKLDTAVREQRLLEERLYKIQVSHEEIQKTASRLETERNAVEKKKNHLQETVGMQGYELLNVRKQLDDIEGIDKFSKDRIEFLKEQLEEINSPYDDGDNEVESDDGNTDMESDEDEHENEIIIE